MKLFKHTGQWDECVLIDDLGIGLKPQSVLVEWFGMYYLAPKDMLANGLELLSVHRKMTPKDELPIVTFDLASCVPVPQAVAKILIEEIVE